MAGLGPLFALCLFVLWPYVGAQSTPVSIRPDKETLSPALQARLKTLRNLYWRTPSGRTLMALTGHIEVLEREHLRGPYVRYTEGENPSFIVDPVRAEKETDLEFETAFFIVRQAAVFRSPVPLVDALLAGEQSLLEYALEKAAAEPAFSRRLRAATREGKRILGTWRKDFDTAEEHGTDGRVFYPGERPRDVMDRLGFDLYLFSEDPYLFYAAVVGSGPPNPDAVSLTELEDFIDLHGEHLDRAGFKALGRTALLEGRAYPGRILRAARSVRDRDGLARLRERLRSYQSVGQRELQGKVNAWLRENE